MTEPATRKDVTPWRLRYRPLLPELLAIYPRLTADQPSWRRGHRQVAHIAHGWYLRCHRGVEAILLLDKNGFAAEAAPLRRSVIEHVVALQWLAAEGDRMLKVVDPGGAGTVRAHTNATAAVSWTSGLSPAEIDALVASVPGAGGEEHSQDLMSFVKRVEAYGDKHVLPGYIAESARSRPSYESAISYVDRRDGGLLWESNDDAWQIPFCVANLLQALLAFQTVFDGEPLKQELDRIRDRFFEITNEVRREDGLPPLATATGPT